MGAAGTKTKQKGSTRVYFLAKSALKIVTFNFPSVLVHNVTTEKSSFK